MKKKRALEERKQRQQHVKDNIKKSVEISMECSINLGHFSLAVLGIFRYDFRLMEQENEWKADVEAQIAFKDAKSRMLQMEKDEVIQEVTQTKSSPKFCKHVGNVYLFVFVLFPF